MFHPAVQQKCQQTYKTPGLWSGYLHCSSSSSNLEVGQWDHVFRNKFAPVVVFRKCAYQTTLIWISLPVPALLLTSVPSIVCARTAGLRIGTVTLAMILQGPELPVESRQLAGWAIPSLASLYAVFHMLSCLSRFPSCWSLLTTLYATPGCWGQNGHCFPTETSARTDFFHQRNFAPLLDSASKGKYA